MVVFMAFVLDNIERNSSAMEEVCQIQRLFSNPSWLVRKESQPPKTRSNIPTCLVTPDVVGAGPPSDNKFQPIASFVSIAMLGNENVVGLTFLSYGRKHVTCCL